GTAAKPPVPADEPRTDPEICVNSNSDRGQWLELVLWLVLVVFLYIHSFDFSRELETYRYGAAAWPRAVLFLLVVAAAGQAVQAWRLRTRATGDDGPPVHDPNADAPHRSTAWSLGTAFLIAIPVVYVVAPAWYAAGATVSRADMNEFKLVLAGVLVLAYVVAGRRNHFDAILSLPILFAAFLQDFGFYALTPVFVPAVMYLMGERRALPMAAVTAATLAVILVLFVSILYIGLPTGNISPFYEIGTTVVAWLQ